MTTLHITNGDAAGNIIKRCRVAGDVLPWRDPMHHGPFPAGLELDDLSRIRARYLSGPNVDAVEAEREFGLRNAHLRAASKYDRVVLWFEHDLLDQLQLLQLLDWFGHGALSGTALDLICINTYPGIDPFRGIGQLDPDQMARLFDGRRPVAENAFTVAKSGWVAFRSDDPHALVEFLRGDLEGMPFLRSALTRHLEEYPSAGSGLTRTEHQLLSLVADGVRGPGELFARNMDLETALYIGDWRTFWTIDTLCKAALLTCEPGPFWHPPGSVAERKAFLDQRLYLTDEGRRVVSGKRHAADLIDRDMWLGGVHLRSDRPMWTWDAQNARPVMRDP